jgi:hypothetical protein
MTEAEQRGLEQSANERMGALQRRDRVVFGAVLLVAALLFGALGHFANTWARYIALGAAFMFGSWGIDFLLTALPRSRAREWIRTVVALPAAVLIVVLRVSMAISTPFFLVFLLFVLILTAYSLALRIFIPIQPFRLGVVYLALLSAISVAAYCGDRLLIPLRWYLRIEGRSSDRETFYDAQAAIRLINFRRLAYLLAIAMYSAASFVQLTGVQASLRLHSLISVSSITLIGFLAVDAYIAAFHKRLIEDRVPLEFERTVAVGREG